MTDSLVLIEKDITHGRLYHALLSMHKPVSEAGIYDLTEHLRSLLQNYRYLLDYFASGGDDPMRGKLLADMSRQALALVDNLWLALFRQNGMRMEMERRARDFQTDGSKIADWKRQFYDIWSGRYQMSELTADNPSPLLPSALTIRLLFTFNKDLLILLLNLTRTDDIVVRVRAQAGLVLVLQRYDERLQFYPEIKKAIDKLLADKQQRAAVREIFHSLLSTALTPTASQEMESLHKDLIRTGTDERQVLTIIEDIDEDNPNWKDGIGQSLRQHTDRMQKLYESGADIHYSSTRGIVGMDFFRNDIANWFMPFVPDNPDIGIDFTTEQGKVLKGLILFNSEHCDFDSYALCLLFKFADNKLFKDGVPPVIKEMGEFGKFGSENNPLNEKQLIRGYIRSLYRFFMDNPWGEENRMKYATQIGTCSLFRQAFTLKQQVRFADRAMALGCYNEAETIYNGFEQTTEVMQKLGLAQLKQEKYDKAAFTFDEALALQEDTWTLSQLARCLRQMNQKQKALRVYNRLLTLQPDRKSALQYKAQLLLDLGRNDEAMQVFYQLEALYPNDPNSSRGMGWCAFLTGKDSEAEKYLEQAAYSETATANDLVNYGHLLLATGHRAEALQIYLSARPKLEKNSQLLNMILADKALLEKKGIDQPTLSLLIDTLLRMLKERKQ